MHVDQAGESCFSGKYPDISMSSTVSIINFSRKEILQFPIEISTDPPISSWDGIMPPITVLEVGRREQKIQLLFQPVPWFSLSQHTPALLDLVDFQVFMHFSVFYSVVHNFLHSVVNSLSSISFLICKNLLESPMLVTPPLFVFESLHNFHLN